MKPDGGPLALVGSGEYTPAMDQTDRLLLDAIGGAASGRVALFPTASALEPGMPERWNREGVEHFARLGANVTPYLLLQREDADNPALDAGLPAHNFYYFSGGSPDYLIETLKGTRAWATLNRQYTNGAALAGCSAGAMMLGGYTTSVREMRRSGRVFWREALGLLPSLAVMPHFDRMRGFMTDELFRALLAAAPEGVTLVGIDEDTALLRLPGRGWQVSGRQTVSIFERGSDYPAVYRPGQIVPLPDANLPEA